MPIYAYRCSACGHEKDHLQKLSDPELHICPQCGQATYEKQVTAAGFQLKGSGWYVTDFKGGNKPPSAATGKAEVADKPETATDKPEKADKPSAESGSVGKSGTCTAN